MSPSASHPSAAPTRAGDQQPAQHTFAGARVASTSDAYLELVSPADGTPIGRIPAGSAEDAERAVAAARSALPQWRARSFESRAAAIGELLEAFEAQAEELAREQEREMGQPYEVALEAVHAYVADQRRLLAAGPPPDEVALGGARVVHEPRGVGALIVPWNYPIPIAIEGLVALLMTGNTVVWKPSERSSLSAVLAMRRLADVFPAGEVNLLLGDGRSGEPLAAHPDVDVVVFTGSVATGRRVAQLAGDRLAKAVLELGGKDPAIVDAGVDPDWAAEQVALGAFSNAGQLCTSIERIYVHEQVADDFIERLAARAAEFEIGPMVDRRQRELVERHVEAAVADGARLLTGGEAPDGPSSYYPPTVLADVPLETALMRDETFGPVAPVHVVSSFEQALELATDSEFGLGGSVFSADPDHLERAARELRVAWLWLNEWGAMAPGAEAEPQGCSGLGMGAAGLWSELRTARYVHDGKPKAAGE